MPRKRPRAAAETENKPKFFVRPASEIPAAPPNPAPRISDLAPSDDYFAALLSDERAQIIRSDIVFDDREAGGSGLLILSEMQEGSRVLRVEVTVEELRLFHVLDRDQARKLLTALDFELRD